MNRKFLTALILIAYVEAGILVLHHYFIPGIFLAIAGLLGCFAL